MGCIEPAPPGTSCRRIALHEVVPVAVDEGAPAERIADERHEPANRLVIADAYCICPVAEYGLYDRYGKPRCANGPGCTAKHSGTGRSLAQGWPYEADTLHPIGRVTVMLAPPLALTARDMVKPRGEDGDCSSGVPRK